MDKFKNRFNSVYPGKFFLRNSIQDIENYLRFKNWISRDEILIKLEKPGEGNMNFVVRIKTNHRSFILKQARPWVEKYPHIDAPAERNHVETLYYQEVSREPLLKSFSPEILDIDPDNFVIAFSDLGAGSDFTRIYQKGNQISVKEFSGLISYLSHLHRINPVTFPYNGEMRKLNHEHIFLVPFMENNKLNLDEIQPGLQEASLQYKNDPLLKSEIGKLGDIYLQEGPVLIHGDYFPGSWITSEIGLKVIDPEFSFMGYPEIDLGIMTAHLYMAQQELSTIKQIISLYDYPQDFNRNIFSQFTGIEILRRLLGVGQLPLTLSLGEKKELMASASGWIMNGTLDL